MNDIVIAQILFHESDVHWIAFEIDVKNISLLIEKSLDVHAFAIGGFEIAAGIGDDQNFEGRARRSHRPRGRCLAGAGDPADREATAKKLAAVVEQFPGYVNQAVV